MFKINLDYGRKEVKEGDLTNQELTAYYISTAVQMAFKDKGLSNSETRAYARVQRKLDEGMEDKADEIEIAEGDLEFIVDAFKKALCPPEIAKFYVIAEDEVKRAQEEIKNKQSKK